MEEFIKNNWGYILGIALSPITWRIFKTFKSTINKKDAPKNSSNTNHS